MDPRNLKKTGCLNFFQDKNIKQKKYKMGGISCINHKFL